VSESESFQYPEYNLNIISLNYLVTNYVEPAIQQFCLTHNIDIRPNSRDVKRLILHFVADSIIQACARTRSTLSVLNFAKLDIHLIGTNMSPIVNTCIHQILKRFKLCHVAYACSIDHLNTQQLYHIKSIVDACNIKPKSLAQIKRFLQTNQLTQLAQRVATNVVVQHTLSK
jgi:chloramphenicol O-acetyltransferase